MRSFLLIMMFLPTLLFSQENEEIPCTGGPVVHFKKGSYDIIETPCDSLHFLYEAIKHDTTGVYNLIGIFTVRDDRPAPNSNLIITEKEARKRAKKVKKALMKMGIANNRFKIYVSYHQPPTPNNHHDWPFYPETYTYEIGVYCMPEYDQ